MSGIGYHLPPSALAHSHDTLDVGDDFLFHRALVFADCGQLRGRPLLHIDTLPVSDELIRALAGVQIHVRVLAKDSHEKKKWRGADLNR
jgi:hypothetical protein